MAAPDAAVPSLPIQDRLLRRYDRRVRDALTALGGIRTLLAAVSVLRGPAI
jgi:hypothetical protein